MSPVSRSCIILRRLLALIFFKLKSRAKKTFNDTWPQSRTAQRATQRRTASDFGLLLFWRRVVSNTCNYVIIVNGALTIVSNRRDVKPDVSKQRISNVRIANIDHLSSITCGGTFANTLYLQTAWSWLKEIFPILIKVKKYTQIWLNIALKVKLKYNPQHVHVINVMYII